MHFTSIVIAGGALKVISVIGCIKYLQEKDLIKNIKNLVGTSAGSIMCLFLALDYKFAEIIDFLVHNLNDPEINTFDPTECFDILTNYGMNSGKNIELLLQRIIYKKLKLIDISFIELAKLSGKNLVVCVANLSKEQTEFFNVDTMPNLSIVTAIRISCCIPIIYSPLTINDDIYMDGGMYNNFPIDYFKNNTLKDILGINIVYKNYKSVDNLFSYINFIVNSLVEKVNSKILNDIEKNIIIMDFIEDDWFSLTELKLKFPKEHWVSYINMGYKNIKEKLEII
jgi:predicted acylesterase/phospholipase RssA